MATIGCFKSFHSLHSRLTTLRMRWCKVRVCVLEDLGHRLLQLEGRLGEDHATLQQEGSHLVDHRRANALTKRLNYAAWPAGQAGRRATSQRTGILSRSPPRGLPRHPGSRSCWLHKRLHKLGGTLHVVALFSQNTSGGSEHRTSLHPDQTGLHVRGEGDELLLSELLRNSTLLAALSATR